MHKPQVIHKVQMATAINAVTDVNISSVDPIVEMIREEVRKDREFDELIKEIDEVLVGTVSHYNVPTPHSTLQRNLNPEVAKKVIDSRDQHARYYIRNSKNLPKLKPGTVVSLQDSWLNLWNKECEVIDISSNGRSCKILLPNGGKYWRNHLLFKCRSLSSV